MLYYTKIELELLTDYDMHLILEQGIRGGITVCVKKHSVANNRYIPDTFDPNKPSKFLSYLDA